MLDRALYWVSENRFLRQLLIPLMRAYIRYAPFVVGKEAFWSRIVCPYFAWHPYDFVASTWFGSRIAGNTKEVIEQCIYYFGVFEPNLTHWVRQRMSPGDAFIDVGANIGYITLLASKLVGRSGKVVALEASPEIFRGLERNLARNRATNVRAVNIAVSDSRGTLKLFRGPEHNKGMTGLLEEQLGIKKDFDCVVEAAPLSAILDADEIRKARLIKIDVEGGECAVVTGMEPIFNAGRSDLEVIVEIHPELLEAQGKRVQDLLERFQHAGFHAYRLVKDYEYATLSRLTPPPRPVRLRGPIVEEADIVFSRIQADRL